MCLFFIFIDFEDFLNYWNFSISFRFEDIVVDMFLIREKGERKKNKGINI